jgi:hypothetical protein
VYFGGFKMENKTQTTGETEADGETSKQSLNAQWGDKQIVLSLNQAKRILLAFKQEKIKDGKNCLIFDNNLFGRYRRVGQQSECQVLPWLPEKIKKIPAKVMDAIGKASQEVVDGE